MNDFHNLKKIVLKRLSYFITKTLLKEGLLVLIIALYWEKTFNITHKKSKY